jgi:hypothetical protein
VKAGIFCEVLAGLDYGGNSYKYGNRLDLTQRAYLFYVLTEMYPRATVVTWQEGVVLTNVSKVLCSQWLPQKKHEIWKIPVLKLVLTQVSNPRFQSWLDSKSFPLLYANQPSGFVCVCMYVCVYIYIYVCVWGGGGSDAEMKLRVFSRSTFTPEKIKRQPQRMVSSCCKDHHFSREIGTQKYRRALEPEVVRVTEVIYHGDGLYPTKLKNTISLTIP